MHERHYRLFIPCLIGLADSASASGTRAAQMEPLGTIWNARRATGTAAGSGTREAQMERPQGNFVLFVGRRYYLRPIISWNARRASRRATALGAASPYIYNRCL